MHAAACAATWHPHCLATAACATAAPRAEQRHVVKVPPMQTLSDALAAAAPKFRPPLVPGRVRLLLNKKPLDLATPFRLLNVPAGSRLDVVKQGARAHAVLVCAIAWRVCAMLCCVAMGRQRGPLRCS